jgi:hypothetical protein
MAFVLLSKLIQLFNIRKNNEKDEEGYTSVAFSAKGVLFMAAVETCLI